MYDLELDIASWKDALRVKGVFSDEDEREMEGHLRDEVADLSSKGLSAEEAFIIAVRRIGNLHTIASEFGKTRTDSTFRQFAFGDDIGHESNAQAGREVLLVAVLAVVSGILVKIPALFGFGEDSIVILNASFFVLPGIIALSAFKRAGSLLSVILPLAGGIVMALTVNMLPFVPDGQTFRLTALSLPAIAWFLCSFAYAGTIRGKSGSAMDFIKVSGETFLYGVLALCGIGVLIGFTSFLFGSLGVRSSGLIDDWLMPSLVFSVPVVAFWLADSKSSVIQNIAPLLARIFIPLFVVLYAAFLAVFAFTAATRGTGIDFSRDVLIGFDLLLALTLALAVYSQSARNDRESIGFFDIACLVLVCLAFVSDGLALAAMTARLATWGISANKVAALGMNIILMGNLGGLAYYLARSTFRGTHNRLTLGFQSRYLWVIVVYIAIVAFAFPPFFAFG